MCGIAGFYGFKNPTLIRKISTEIAHRGPDGEGIFENKTVSLLNRRLAIIDLKTGEQPKFNESRDLVVVYNGEIYNFRQLRDELKKKGHKFYTESDTEVIVKGYEEWSEQCFDKFNGMFAIAIYERKQQKLVLARDHFGIKPLYYSILGKKLIFSSEIKPIIGSGLIKKEPNDKIIYRYLKYRVHDDQSETFFKNVYKLMPGEMMIIDKNGINKQNFSHLKTSLFTNNSQEKFKQDQEIERFRTHFRESVKLRLISDVPLGTCLSGGLDSSTVVVVVNNLLKEKIKESESIGKIQKTFSAVFPNSANDEERYINDLIRETQSIKNFKIKPTPKKFMEDLEDFVKTQEEPTISTGPYAQYQVMKEASKYVKVVLDGQGSDEMLAGYDPYFFVYFRQLISEKKFFKLFKEIVTSADLVFKYLYLKLLSWFWINKPISVRKVLNADFYLKYVDEKFETTSANLKKRLIEDIFHNSLPALLRYEDKNSMRFSIEGRVPFLDFNLVEYIFSLPTKAFIKNGWNKNILRNAFSYLLPASIAKRRNKIGFTTPELEWFRSLKKEIHTIFLSESFASRKYFNRQGVTRAFQLFNEGKNDDTMLFWRLMNLEIWLRMFFDEKKQINEKETKIKPVIDVEGTNYKRFPIKTGIFAKNDDYVKKITDYTISSIEDIGNDKKWFLAISEKIIAIAQGRSFFLWEIKPGFWATTLSKFILKTPYGIGLGSPWTMQLAIKEVGLAKILTAALVAGLTKPFGFKGLFYRVAGREVAAIDGPTEYSLYPSNVSAKLAPKNPDGVVERIHQTIKKRIQNKNNFLGVAIIDANDLGQNVLANSSTIDNKLIEKIFSDNPLGQEKEQTPLAIVKL